MAVVVGFQTDRKLRIEPVLDFAITQDATHELGGREQPVARPNTSVARKGCGKQTATQTANGQQPTLLPATEFAPATCTGSRHGLATD